ncbi:hypothetical protein F5Y13DRAFT_198450 [Hypoxylon sp. FL1857]|nr:hypothetical protein F5Y13DRAFT_198450 [Hypoxylon sp. FL1857]
MTTGVSSVNGTAVESVPSQSANSATSDMDRTRIGIGVGAAVGGILLGASVSIVFFRYSRKKLDTEPNPQGNRTHWLSRGISDIPRSYPAGSQVPGSDRGPRSYTTYRGEEVSSIYPDESASCFRPDAPCRSTQAYATDFAVADTQIWTEHLQSGSSREPGTMPENEAVDRVDWGMRAVEEMSEDGHFSAHAIPLNMPAR